MTFSVGGARPSHPAKLAERPHVSSLPRVASLLASPPPYASMQSHEPTRADQGAGSYCTACSGSEGVYTSLAARGTPLPFVPSFRHIYAGTRAVERAMTTLPGAELPLFTDGGAELADVFTALSYYGVVPIQAPSPDGRFSDIWTPSDIDGIPSAPPANVNDEPSVLSDEAGQQALIVGSYAITPGDGASAAAAIAAGCPLYIATFVDTAFMGWMPGQPPFGVPNSSDPRGGGHAMYIDAYSTNVDGSRIWRCVSSWGTMFADQGAALVSDAFLKACWEIHALDVSVKTVAQ